MNPAFLAFVANPDHALLLLLAGILLLYAEFNRPGTVIPGCIGALCILFAVEGLLHLQLRTFASAEIAFGLALLAAGILLPMGGATPSVASVMLAVGLNHLVVTPPVSPVISVATSVVFCSVTFWLGRVALRARRNKTIYTRFEPYPSIPPVKPSVPLAG